MILLCTLFLFALIAHGLYGTGEPLHNIYHGTIINQDNIVNLVPSAPPEITQAVQQWLVNNKDFVDSALGYEKLIGPKHPFRQNTMALLQKKGIKNLSRSSYVFSIPELEDYIVKMTWQGHRIENLNTLSAYLQHPDNPFDPSHYAYGTTLTEASYVLFAEKLQANDFDNVQNQARELTSCHHAPKTYQTISRIAHYLLFLQAVEQYQLVHVTVPAMYLVHIPGRPNDVSDRNYVVIEQRLENLRTITSPDELDQAQRDEIEIIIKTVGLFNIVRGNIFLTADEKIVFIDLEQPNNSNPLAFFHKAEDRFHNNVRAGLASFEKKNFSKGSLAQRVHTLLNLQINL